MSKLSFSASSRKSGPKFTEARKGTGIRTGKDGGVNIGTPTHCTSGRSAPNLKGIYSYKKVR